MPFIILTWIFYYLLVAVIGFVILCYVVKAAVKNGIEESRSDR